MVDIDQIQADIDFVENDPDHFWAVARAVWRLYLAIPDMMDEVKLLRNKQRETVAKNMKDMLCSAFSSELPPADSADRTHDLHKAESAERAIRLLRNVVIQGAPIPEHPQGSRLVPWFLMNDIVRFLRELEEHE